MSSRRPAPRTTLFVAGFPPSMRARDLAYEFERMGPLVRCDIPALRSPNATPYAFIEYEDPRDAEAAHADMHGMRFGRHALSIQFAKNAPSSNWRFGGDGPSRGPPPPPAAQREPSLPPPRVLDPAEQEEADRAAEERARLRAAARERRSRSPDTRSDREMRSQSRRADEDRYQERQPVPTSQEEEDQRDAPNTNGNGDARSPEEPTPAPAAGEEQDAKEADDKKSGWSP